MKRSNHLVPLSRDHHHGLLFSWKIRQGVALNIATERIVQYISYFYKMHFRQHFQEEETIIFIPVNDADCQRALREHREIEQRIREITRSKPDAAALLSLADLTDAHIRFEERELFPHLEKVLSEEQLLTIGNAVQQSHTEISADTYPDAFWVSSGKG